MYAQTPIEQKIDLLILPSITKMGYNIVRIKYGKLNNLNTLQIMIERLDNEAITVDDCTAVSRQISTILDVNDPIDEQYNLEISSPGIDRPLTKLDDFSKFIDNKVKIKTNQKILGTSKFSGILLGTKENNVIIKDADNHNEITIDFDIIKSAKLVNN